MQQLGLPISLNAKMRLDNFSGQGNQALLAFIDSLFTQPNAAVVFIVGDVFSGKTHFLQGCIFQALAQNLNAIYLDLSQSSLIPNLATLTACDWIAVDNIEQLNPNQQQQLFDLYNQIKTTKTKLVVSAKSLPSELNLLKDLKTRLSLAVVYRLDRLDDDEKIGLIQAQMQAKNIRVDYKIYAYLFKHFSRDLRVVLALMAELERKSLQQKSVISITFIKKNLKN
jgi:DnaA family protein